MGLVLKNVNITGGKLSSTVDAPTGWVRNPDWLPLPEITAADNRFVGLFLIFEDEYNQLPIYFAGSSISINVDWGDGSSVVVSSSGTQTKIYDYNTVISPIKSYYDGRNYKQVLVDITVNSGTLTSFWTSATPSPSINRSGFINWGDISFSLPSVTDLRFSGTNFLVNLGILEIVSILNHNVTAGSFQCNNLFSLRKADIKLDNITTGLLQFSNIGKLDAEPFNIDLSSRSSVTSLFANKYSLEQIGNFSANLATTNSSQLFYNCYNIKKIGNIELLNATDATRWFSNCYNINSIGIINTPQLTSLVQTFSSCWNLKSIVFSDCTNVSNTTSTFNNCGSLQELILPNITVGFSISDCNLSTKALNNLFTSLGTANGSQTIIVTGNPGAATCDTSIATNKGFTITI